MKIMKKFLPLIAIAALFLYPNQSAAQSYEDWYNFGAAIGSAVRQGVDKAKERREAEYRRQQEEARRQQEEAERERQYQLERQRVENERIMAEQKAAEERRLEQERIRQTEEAKRAEEERIREAQRIEEEKQRRAEAEIEKKAAEEELDLYNTSAHILSPRNEAIFRTSDGHELILYIQSDKLLYKNYSEKEELVICNNATIKIKYANEPNEETLNDACQIRLNPTGSSYGEIPLSDVFFNISSFKEIEFVKIRLSDTKIRNGRQMLKKQEPAPQLQDVKVEQMYELMEEPVPIKERSQEEWDEAEESEELE